MEDRATEKELRRLTAIARIHHSIGSNLRLEEISRILVRELMGIVSCDGCAILLIEGDKVRILAEGGFSKTFAEVGFDVDMKATKHIVDTKRGIFTGDIVNSPAASCVRSRCSMNSLICTPIVVNGEVRGIIHLDSLKKNAFDEEDMELTELLAKEVSIAIERSFLYSQVWDISIRDELTGCFNRRKFDVDIVADIANAKQYGKPLCFLMADIDWFKKYNDFYGHPKGDVLLKRISNMLVSNMRPLDRAYRYGGEEFAILLPDTDKERASHVAKRLRQTVAREQFEGEKESQPNKKVTISIGVAGFPSDAEGSDGLIEAADSALYRAKESGRNRVCVFGDEQ